MSQPPTDPEPRARGPFLVAASVLGMIVPFVLPLGVLVVAANDRREMERGRRAPEPPFLYRLAMALSAFALIAQCAILVLATDVWSGYVDEAQTSGEVGVVGDACVVADACCEAVHGAGAAPCRDIAERAGELEDTTEDAESEADRMVCVERLRALRAQLDDRGRPIPEACAFAAPLAK